LEFGVTAAIDFGVASGSVKVVAGIYLAIGVTSQVNPDGKLELTGFILIEGKVEVMLVVTLTIRMEAAITYVPDTKKAIVRASVMVEVKVLLFSDTVEVKYQRTFGGSVDPTFGDTLTQDDWNRYADAFAPIGV